MQVPTPAVRATVPGYVPILKARLAEFTAIEHAEEPVRSLIRPVLEVMPEVGLPRDATRFYTRVTEHVPGGITICFDTCHLAARFGPRTAADALIFISDYLSDFGYSMLPVIRLNDGDGLIHACALAAETHGLGACIRMGLDRQRGALRFRDLLKLNG